MLMSGAPQERVTGGLPRRIVLGDVLAGRSGSNWATPFLSEPSKYSFDTGRWVWRRFRSNPIRSDKCRSDVATPTFRSQDDPIVLPIFRCPKVRFSLITSSFNYAN